MEPKGKEGEVVCVLLKVMTAYEGCGGVTATLNLALDGDEQSA